MMRLPGTVNVVPVLNRERAGLTQQKRVKQCVNSWKLLHKGTTVVFDRQDD